MFGCKKDFTARRMSNILSTELDIKYSNTNRSVNGVNQCDVLGLLVRLPEYNVMVRPKTNPS